MALRRDDAKLQIMNFGDAVPAEHILATGFSVRSATNSRDIVIDIAPQSAPQSVASSSSSVVIDVAPKTLQDEQAESQQEEIAALRIRMENTLATADKLLGTPSENDNGTGAV